LVVNTSQTVEHQVIAASDAIRRRITSPPQIGIILGSGLGDLAAHVDPAIVIPYEELPPLPRSTAIGHRGRFVVGQYRGADVIVMDGRVHLYEGYDEHQITLPLRVMHALGASTLIVSNASGGLNPQLQCGDVMIVDAHVNLLWGRVTRRARAVYDAELAETAMRIARHHNFAARRGVYAAVTGPTYETRAEYRMLRRIGADAVGMSTVPEVLVASELGMRVLALSTITNVARPDVRQTVNAEHVVQAARDAQGKVRMIVEGILESR
jgi:purine-nucleoside phosphorylase